MIPMSNNISVCPPLLPMRWRKRDGRCYELTGKMLFNAPPDTPWKLVHAMVKHPRLGICGHAWLSSGDWIDDPVPAKRVFHVAYHTLLLPRVSETVYDQEQMMTQLHKHMHWGPWDAVNGTP